MPRQAQITVFRYEELDAKVKEKIRDQYRRDQSEEVNEHFLKDRFIEVLEEKGYPTSDIHWSLSSSQGDGVAFYGKVDTDGLAKIVARLAASDPTTQKDSLVGWQTKVSMLINKTAFSHRYSHSRTMDVALFAEDEPFEDDTFDRLSEAVLEDVRSTSRELEALGYALLYPKETDEDTDEDIAALDREYTIDGKEFIE